MKKAIIVFSGFNTRAVVSFLRTAKKHKIDYAVIAKSEDDEIFKTHYGSKVLAVRDNVQLDIHDILDKVQTIQKKVIADSYVIAPSTEALNRFLLSHLDRVKSANCELPLVGEQLYSQISDKESFSSLCRAKNISVPQQYSNVPESFPYVAKPKKYLSENGQTLSPVLVMDESQHRKFLREYQQEKFFYQEYISGRSLYLLYYFYKDSSIAKYSQENFLQQPGGKSIIAAVGSDFHFSDVSRSYEELFLSVGFRGLIMVEVKVCDGKNYMIEANPRFWGPSQLFVDAGVNFFESFFADNDITDVRPIFRKPTELVRYFWLGGLMGTFANNRDVTYHNYSAEQYAQEKDEWTAADIYNREDTRKLFIEELKVRQ